MAVSKDDLRNMSPEQILQLQKENCIFCQIVSGKIPARKVFESEFSVGILDINPATEGHVILLPKEHFQIMALMPQTILGNFFVDAKNVSQSLLKNLKAEGTFVFAANGSIAGQRAPHFMLHIIPRLAGDGVNLQLPYSSIDHSDVELLIRGKVKDVFGYSSQDNSITEKDLAKIKPSHSENKKLNPDLEKKKNSEKEDSIDLDDLADLLNG